MSGDLEEREVTISGVKVVFPCKPYPSQFGMMDRVIKGLERGQNCLLESPTGSGKSLALLCSALAWQNAQHLKIAKETMSQPKKEAGTCDACQRKSEGNVKQESTSLLDQNPKDSTNMKDGACNDDDDDDFKVPSKQKTPFGQNKSKKRGHVSISYEDENSSPKNNSQTDKCTCSCNNDCTSSNVKQKVPKIYFGTRTHKQIAQIVRELRKTAYHDVRMVILASREYSCVHPEVVKQKNKSEGCRERLDIHGPGCTYNDRAKRIFLSQGQLQSELNSAWDLEELVHACKRKKACPYFVTRNVKEQADIVFCPYNYLIDPLVRKSMEINLKDQIVILDEAHNIEDCARDAASGQLSTIQINQTMQNLQELLDVNVKFSDHLILKRMMENVMRFVDDNSNNLDQADYDTSYKVWSGYDMVARLKNILYNMENVMRFVDDNSNNLDQADYDTSYKVWSGYDMVARLKNIGLGPDTLSEYKACLDRVSASDDDQQQNTMRNFRGLEIKLQSTSIKNLELLLQILDYMYRNDLKFVEDYRVAVMKSVEYVSRNTNDSWLGKNRRGKTREIVFTLNFWCMNPAVAFSDFDPCRNVVLSSGTLSPMNSFASELGVPFPIQLEANHVIKDDQVWVGSIGCGPSGSQLQAVYKNMETFTFQDELGNLVLDVCKKVPYGVLCFLPSYRALEKFTDRWKITRMWEQLAVRKRILIEPRAADREDFDYMMKLFYEVVKNPEHCFDDDEPRAADREDFDYMMKLFYEVVKNPEHCFDDDEPRAADREDFDYMMKLFYEVVKNPEHCFDDDDECIDTSERDGAIFFAVCRGKVSEGMDFADNNARAVITVGIPFPSIKDLQVKLKREYNDKYRSERGLLSGNEWYEIQAFRALNQALGRCIRHRKDWGAIIIVDDRFVRQAGRYVKGLSKWVRNKVQTHETFPRFLESVSNFTEKMKKEMPVVNPDTSFIPSTPSTPNVNRRSVYHNQAAAGPDTSFIPSTPSTPNVNRRSVYHNQAAASSPNFTSPASQQTSPHFNQNASPSLTSPPSQNVTSKFFMTPNGSSPRLPNRYKSVKSLLSNKAAPSNINQNPEVPIVQAPSVPGMTLYDQLVSIMKSPGIPSDKPYCIIMDKGTSAEQMFHVDPSKMEKEKSSPTATATTTSAVPIQKTSAVTSPATNTSNAHAKEPSNTTFVGLHAVGVNTGLNYPTTADNGSPVGAVTTTGTTNQPDNNALTQVLATIAPGIPINTQLINIMNSAAVPKDKPYYIVFNKGFADEQMFHIDPSKRVKSDAKSKTESMKLTSLLKNNTICTEKNATNSLIMPVQNPRPVPSPVSATAKRTLKTFAAVSAPGQPLQDQLKEMLSSPALPKDEPYYIVFNKGTKDEQTLLIEPNTNGKKPKLDSPKPVSNTTSKLHGSTIVIDEPEIKTPDLPDLNTTPAPPQGMLTSQQISQMAEANKYLMFCDLPKLENATVTTKPETLPAVLENTKQNNRSPDLFASSVEDSLNMDRDVKPQSFDLKPAQNTSDTNQEKNESGNDPAKKKPIFRKAGKLNSNNETKTVGSVKEQLGQFLKTKQKDLNSELTDDKTKSSNDEETPQTKSNTVKDRQSELSTEENKSKLDTTENVPVTSDISKVTGVIDNEKQPPSNKKQQPTSDKGKGKNTNRRLSRGKCDRSVIDKLKSIVGKQADESKGNSTEQQNDKEDNCVLMNNSKTGSAGKQNEKQEEINVSKATPLELQNEKCRKKIVLQDITLQPAEDNENVDENDAHSDEEFLNTRRKSGRKRFPSWKGQNASKRQKGIEYEDEAESSKENKNKLSSCIKCLKCGSSLLKSTGFSQGKDFPIFTKDIVGKKPGDIVSGHLHRLDGTSLQILTETNMGISLDSHYIPDSKCCVQYLQCKDCTRKNQTVIGARVVMAETRSEFKYGQVWLSASAVKM